MTEKPKEDAKAGYLAPWSQQLQTSPPSFGDANLVGRTRLNWEIFKRRNRVQRVLTNPEINSSFSPGLISIVILCCKRPDELKRLVDSLQPFLKDIESDVPIETVLVDNGSGPSVTDYAERSSFFDKIIAHEHNLGMAVALNDAYPKCKGEFILLLEEDFILDYPEPFLGRCIRLFNEFPDIGIIRLKNQNNWGKPFRVIAPLRHTIEKTAFWTWLPSKDGRLNVWAAGSVMFRKSSFLATGPIPVSPNKSRDTPDHQGSVYELDYGKRYNKTWLAAKIRDCYPFIQPNDTPPSPGWGEVASRDGK